MTSVEIYSVLYNKDNQISQGVYICRMSLTNKVSELKMIVL